MLRQRGQEKRSIRLKLDSGIKRLAARGRDGGRWKSIYGLQNFFLTVLDEISIVMGTE